MCLSICQSIGLCVNWAFRAAFRSLSWVVLGCCSVRLFAHPRRDRQKRQEETQRAARTRTSVSCRLNELRVSSFPLLLTAVAFFSKARLTSYSSRGCWPSRCLSCRRRSDSLLFFSSSSSSQSRGEAVAERRRQDGASVLPYTGIRTVQAGLLATKKAK